MELPPHKIAVIQLRAIGDVLLTTPLVRSLKNAFPQADIDFVTNAAPAECLRGNQNLRNVIIYPFKASYILGPLKVGLKLRRNKYDVVIDVLATPGTAQMTFFSGARRRIGYNLRYRTYAYNRLVSPARDDIYNALAKMALLEPLGIVPQNPYPEIFISDEAKQWADRFFAEKGWSKRKVIALAPAAKVPARRWLPAYFAELADWFSKLNDPVIMLWGPGEREYVEGVINMMQMPAELSPPTNLMQLAALLEKCALLVCNCGGTKHFAVAVGTPTLSVYGASDPRAWTPPDDPKHVTVQADDVDCLHCGKRECEMMDCMKRVTPGEVIEVVKTMGVL